MASYQTDAWCYLNLDNPVCAWATYRSVLVQAPLEPGFISVWTASMLSCNQHERLAREFSLETVRQALYPSSVSRLKGMYIFTDNRSAYLAASWGEHFTPDNLAEISLAEAQITGIRHDSNWITYPDEPEWQNHYWSGLPHPRHEPIWESLAEGRLIILGTAIRSRAFEILQKSFPDAMVLLETARMAAWVGSDLGNVAAFLSVSVDECSLRYALDMREAGNPNFQQRMLDLRNSGHPVNREAVIPLLHHGNFITPDFRPYEFTRPIADMPYLQATRPKRSS